MYFDHISYLFVTVILPSTMLRIIVQDWSTYIYLLNILTYSLCVILDMKGEGTLIAFVSRVVPYVSFVFVPNHSGLTHQVLYSHEIVANIVEHSNQLNSIADHPLLL